MPRSILDHPTLSRRYFSPRREAPSDIFWIECNEARLACAYVAPHPGALTLVHFHGNGEVVADYFPDLAADLTGLGVNVLFAEYRGYGASSGEPGMARILLRVRPEELDTTAAELAAEVRAQLDPQAKLNAYPGPVLVLHAQDDSMVDF